MKMKNRRAFKYFTEQLREDLVVTAYEQACFYWAKFYTMDRKAEKALQVCDQRKATSEQIYEAVTKHGASFRIIDAETWEYLGDFNNSGILKGEKLMHKNHYEHWRNAISDNWDAETADVWFQLCIMGELVYG